MKLVFICPKCQSPNNRRIPDENGGTQVSCHGCDWQRTLAAEDIADENPKSCLACGNEDLWCQKDFPQALGLMLVVIGGALSTWAWACYEPVIAIGILMFFALGDLALFLFMKDVLVCYRCRARHRQAKMDQDHPRFNLELAERYRQEAILLEEAEFEAARQASEVASPPGSE
jgi:hypothetical protein